MVKNKLLKQFFTATFVGIRMPPTDIIPNHYNGITMLQRMRNHIYLPRNHIESHIFAIRLHSSSSRRPF